MCNSIVIFSIAVSVSQEKGSRVQMCKRGVFEGCRSLLEERPYE